MVTYVHQQKNWPEFKWDHQSLEASLAKVRHNQGRLIGRMEGMGFRFKEEAIFRTLAEDVLKTSEIEGEILDPEQVRSSLAKRLGIKIAGLKQVDRAVDGIVEMTLDATKNFDKPLTAQRLFGWHAALFPTGWSGMSEIKVGAWRDDRSGPMQVVSGPIGRERIHYEAPEAARLKKEMTAFLKWFESDSNVDPVIRAGIAHLWFVTIHPFEDGNGRIARAITDMMLARSEQIPDRFYSMSTQIRQERNAYYDMLEQAQKSNMNITPWLGWFLACLDRAIDGAESNLALVLRKARFWESLAKITINERQRLILNRMLDGFEGKLTSSKWAKLAKCSQDSALRDISDLVERGILVKDSSGGRSTSYSISNQVF
ncbi:MAG: Fic family protein [Candidatus Obscuribacterales bacterium]|nr:Fic family protein [Candidatus Obscuribacterales bacterium]